MSQAITHPHSPLARSASRQAGFSLIEVSIVTAIVLLLAVIAIPAVGAYVVENKVPKVGEELARFVLNTQINAQPGSATPYAGIGTAHFARMVEGSSLFTHGGTQASPVVWHGLGSAGTVSVAPAESGASFSLTLDKVSHAACPALASVMQRVVHTMHIGEDGEGGTLVKGSQKEYNALSALESCVKGDANTFVFVAG